MKDFRNLKVGDKFVVVDKWVERYGNQNPLGQMDYWLGKTLTIKVIRNDFRSVKSNENNWTWFTDLVDWDKTARINRRVENIE